jgi:hypothetical protein
MKMKGNMGIVVLLGAAALGAYFLLGRKSTEDGGGGGGSGGFSDLVDNIVSGGGAGAGAGALGADNTVVPPGMAGVYDYLSTQLRSTPQVFDPGFLQNLNPYQTAREMTLGEYMKGGGLFVSGTGDTKKSSYGYFSPTGSTTATPLGYGGAFTFGQSAVSAGGEGNMTTEAQKFQYIGTGVLADVTPYAGALTKKENTLTTGGSTFAVVTGSTSQGIVRTGAGAFFTEGTKKGQAFTCSKWVDQGGQMVRIQEPC